MTANAAEHSAFEGFYRASYAGLVRLARYVGADHDAALDAVDQTMLEVFRGWENIANPVAWARRAVCSNFLKGKERDAMRIVREQSAAALTGHIDEGSTTMLWEDHQWVDLMLMKLSPAQREVVRFVMAGWKPVEIALLFGKSPDTIRQNLHQARRRLTVEIQGKDQHNEVIDDLPGNGKEIR